jgi:hypothetical protein
MDYPQIIAKKKSGKEKFKNNNEETEFSLEDFWKWSVSDLLSNATRGRLAEFIVATALGIDVKNQIRDEWSAWDLTTKDGIKVEVKSAAYIQSWNQKEPSKISFLVPKTRAWNPITNKQAGTAERHADVYIFALLKHEKQETIDPLKLDQWSFYVLPTSVLNKRERSQHSIMLASLRNLCGEISYGCLLSEVMKSSN